MDSILETCECRPKSHESLLHFCVAVRCGDARRGMARCAVASGSTSVSLSACASKSVSANVYLYVCVCARPCSQVYQHARVRGTRTWTICSMCTHPARQYPQFAGHVHGSRNRAHLSLSRTNQGAFRDSLTDTGHDLMAVAHRP